MTSGLAWTHLCLLQPPACVAVYGQPPPQSIGSQHHSSVITMETRSGRGHDWARLKACFFVIGRLEHFSLPPPLSDTFCLTHTHTHISLFIVLLHLYCRVTEMGLSSLFVYFSFWRTPPLTRQLPHLKKGLAARLTAPLTSQLY